MSRVLNFPEKREPDYRLPERKDFEVYDGDSAPVQIFTFTDERGYEIRLEFGEQELGPELRVADPNDNQIFSMIFSMMRRPE